MHADGREAACGSCEGLVSKTTTLLEALNGRGAAHAQDPIHAEYRAGKLLIDIEKMPLSVDAQEPALFLPRRIRSFSESHHWASRQHLPFTKRSHRHKAHNDEHRANW